MKRIVFLPVLIIAIMLPFTFCKNSSKHETAKAVEATTSGNTDLIVVAKNIITEIVVKPDSTGDPWEVEKVQGYNGKQMFDKLFENIYNKKLIVYDCLTEKPLNSSEIKKMEKEFGSDKSKIAKIQFSEDWYFNPETNEIRKEIKSVSFGYETKQEAGLPVQYKALFKLKK